MNPLIGATISMPSPWARIAWTTALRARERPRKACTIARTMARTRLSGVGSSTPDKARPTSTRAAPISWRASASRSAFLSTKYW